jgi:hypothetical protein
MPKGSIYDPFSCPTTSPFGASTTSTVQYVVHHPDLSINRARLSSPQFHSAACEDLHAAFSLPSRMIKFVEQTVSLAITNP